MRRYIKNKSQLLMVILIVGFFCGIIYTNMYLKESVHGSTVLQSHILKQYVNTEIIMECYMLFVIKERVWLVLSLVIIGMIKYRKIIAAIWLAIMGFLYGTIVSLSVMELGGSGILVCLIGSVPQAIFYVVAIVFLFQYWFSEPKRQWNGTKMIFVLLILALGIITEVYVNPMIMKMIINLL